MFGLFFSVFFARFVPFVKLVPRPFISSDERLKVATRDYRQYIAVFCEWGNLVTGLSELVLNNKQVEETEVLGVQPRM